MNGLGRLRKQLREESKEREVSQNSVGLVEARSSPTVELVRHCRMVARAIPSLCHNFRSPQHLASEGICLGKSY